MFLTRTANETGISDGYELYKKKKKVWKPHKTLNWCFHKKVSGIITIKPHSHVDGKGIVLDFIVMAVQDKNNDNL